MPKKKIKPKAKNKILKKKISLSKIAIITTRSFHGAIKNFQKKKELKRIREIRLKKLEEKNDFLKEKKDLKIWEDKLRKKDSKLRTIEDELNLKEK